MRGQPPEGAQREEDKQRKVSLRGTDVRLLPLAGSAWVGSLLGLSQRVSLASILLIGVASTMLALLVLWRRTDVLVIVVLAVLVGICAATVANLAASKLSGSALGQAEEGDSVATTAVITGEMKAQQNRWGTNTWSVVARTPASGRVTLMLDGQAMGTVPLIRGTVVHVEGRLGKADYTRLPSLGYLRAESVVLTRPPPHWQRSVASLKATLSGIAQARAGPVGPLIVGMGIGDDRGMEEDLKEAMLTTSLTHLSAVSGSHIALTLTVVGALIPGRRKLKVLLTFAFLIAVVMVVGPQPSVVRAVSMGALAAWGLLLHRGGQPLGVLATVTASTLLLSPWSAISVGFALSTLATLGILTQGRSLVRALWQPLQDKDALAGTKAGDIAKSVLEATSIAVAAQIFTLPVLALMNPWLPTWGVVANLAVAPVVAPITLLGLGAALTCMWAPTVAGALVSAAVPFAKYMEAVAMWIANWPLARFPWPPGILGFTLITLLAAAFVGGATIALNALTKDR